MASNRMTEGVGKKIVEALKKQTEVEITPIVEEIEPDDIPAPAYISPSAEIEFVEDEPVIEEDIIEPSNNFQFNTEPVSPAFNNNFAAQSTNFSQTQIPQPQIFEQAINQNTLNFNQQNNPLNETFKPQDMCDFEIPTNVAVLKQLIAKLPSGVTRQTGAQIIKQTMEALGISMKGVLQEAQQVQEGLSTSARECQTNIMEYRRQIGLLEQQSQKYQKQFATLNDIISLFIQTNN